MFGYVIPDRAGLSPEAQSRYRSAYCGLCRRIDALHGLRGRFSLSYDLTFLNILLCSLYEGETPADSGIDRCPVHPVHGVLWRSADPTDYCADLSVALHYYNAQDKWQDDHNLLALGYSTLLDNSTAEAALDGVCQSFIERSFSGVIKGVNLNNYRTIMSRLGRNIRNTYVFSIVAIVFIIFIGILVSYVLVRKKGKIASLIDTLIMFPYVIPGSVLGIGLIVAFNRKPLILVGTAAIMIISYVIRKLPYTVRSGSAFLYQMDPFVEEASINLGVSPMKTFFTVTARMMLPGIMSGAVLSWITCINELSSSIMLYSGKTSTIAVAIYQEVVRMSDGTAAALATILTLTTIVSLVIVFRATKGKVKIV